MATIAVITGVLLGSEVASEAVRAFWQRRPLSAGLAVGVLTLGATVLLIDEVVARRDRRRWRSLSQHALTELHDACVAARIGIGNFFLSDPRTKPAMNKAQEAARARGPSGEVDDDVYEDQVARHLHPVLVTLRNDPTWRDAAHSLTARLLKHSEDVLSRCAVASIGEEALNVPTDAIATLVRRLRQIDWCLRTIEIATKHRWATREHDRFRIAQDGLPELFCRAYREAVTAMRACDRVQADHYDFARLMDDQIAQDLGIPGNTQIGAARKIARPAVTSRDRSWPSKNPDDYR